MAWPGMLTLSEHQLTPCKVNDPELWFSRRKTDRERAKQLCRGCPQREACLAATLELERSLGHILVGIHAGTTETERQQALERSA